MAACTQGVERGGEVPFRFRPLMTTVTIQVGFSEAAEVQKLVLSSENGPIAGGFTFDIETDRCTVIPGKGSNVLALHLVSGDVPYIQLSAGAKVAVTAFMLPQDIEGSRSPPSPRRAEHTATQPRQRSGPGTVIRSRSATCRRRRNRPRKIIPTGWPTCPTTPTCRRFPSPGRTTPARSTVRTTSTKAGCPAKDTTSNGCRTSYSAI